jgi:hypothetical protein
MKIILLFILTPMLSFSQDTDMVIRYKDSTARIRIAFRNYDTAGPIRYDTLKCMMLVCDTTKQKGVFNVVKLSPTGTVTVQDVPDGYVPYVAWIWGYRVSEYKNSRYTYKYLNHRKNPLPKRLFVWLASILDKRGF